MIALRIQQSRPTLTSGKITHSWSCDPASTLTLENSTQRLSRPERTMQPPETMVSMTVPWGCPSSAWNLADGSVLVQQKTEFCPVVFSGLETHGLRPRSGPGYPSW